MSLASSRPVLLAAAGFSRANQPIQFEFPKAAAPVAERPVTCNLFGWTKPHDLLRGNSSSRHRTSILVTGV
jgi:hypothetical protein